MIRLVLDTNIVISGLLWDGIPSQLFAHVKTGRAGLFTSAVMVAELENVLGRAKLSKKIGMRNMTPQRLLAAYVSRCTLVSPAPLMAIAPDPDDDWVIATAVAAQADMIVTGDSPFLEVREVGSVRIINAVEALQMFGD